MIELKMLTTREYLRKITGLPGDNHDKALWDAGFNTKAEAEARWAEMKGGGGDE